MGSAALVCESAGEVQQGMMGEEVQQGAAGLENLSWSRGERREN